MRRFKPRWRTSTEATPRLSHRVAGRIQEGAVTHSQPIDVVVGIGAKRGDFGYEEMGFLNVRVTGPQGVNGSRSFPADLQTGSYKLPRRRRMSRTIINGRDSFDLY